MFTTISAKRIVTALSITMVSFAAIGVAAQTPPADRFNFFAKRLPQNISQAAAQRLASEAAAAERREDAADEVAEEATMKRIESSLAPERRMLKAALDREAWYAALRRESERISKDPRMTDAQRTAALRALEAKYRPAYARAVRAAGLNLPAIQAKLTRISPDLRLTERFTVVGQVATIGLESKTDEGFLPPAPPPAVSDLSFRLPFDTELDSVKKKGVTLSIGSQARADAQAGKCEGDLLIMHGVGWSRASAAVGKYVTVPPGVKRIVVTARMRRNYSLSATSFLAVSGANSRGSLELSGTNIKRTKRIKEFGSVTAPLLWMTSEGDGDKEVRFSAATDIPAEGATVLVRFRIVGRVYTGGLDGNASSDTLGECREIRVRMFR